MNLGSCPPGDGVPWAFCPKCSAPMRSDGTGCTGAVRHPFAAPEVRLYATWTSTRRNLGEMAARGVRLLTGPDQLSRYGNDIPPLAWAMDNGAWGCFQRGEPFNAGAFRAALSRWGSAADWIVLPDIVAGGAASLDLSSAWAREVRAVGRPVLLAVQDGMTAHDVLESFTTPRAAGYGGDAPRIDGLFVGGSTEWKWRTLPAWTRLATRAGLHVHVGRVNTARKIRLCADLGVDSADGTSMTRFADTAAKLDAASRTPPQPLMLT